MSAIDFMLSERQQKMLGALLLHPDRQYGSNELIAIGGPGYGAGKRILEQFERSAIVVKTARGNQRLYSVNGRHPIYPDLRSICFKTFGIADVIAGELAPFKDRISLAFVFGSIVQGTERADSDVDLMVVGNLDVFDLGGAIERIQKVLGREVDLNLHTSEEWEALQSDQVIGAILKKEKIMVIEQRAGRTISTTASRSAS
ncbi:putative nucleotidyltransferase [Sinorhizobium fredii]|uniref:DNA polymerase beta domain protein region n=1 Tax=Sinorhizobium fredii (strain USDA 257) TaxID=1185652 RepID=I3X9A4_SINF2|nr:nucleotidyltransferase domain-containing protein [Sinorhizobium fredii]AFL52460.1 DNA polymerase beta domain protein region [Sinorhizobium fredii USDA 257]